MSTESTEALIERVLAEHGRVTSGARWDGSPDPSDWRNIRRLCGCGSVIGDHDRSRERPGRSYPMSGFPFDPPHRAHVAAAITQALAEREREVTPVRVSGSSIQRVHNHDPYRPLCNERAVGPYFRGACLNDDGSDR